MYGGKIMFVLGACWLVVWSVVAGVAKNEITLDLARAFAGLGPAAFLPSSIMLLGSVYRPGPRKNLVSLLSLYYAPLHSDHTWIANCAFLAEMKPFLFFFVFFLTVAMIIPAPSFRCRSGRLNVTIHPHIGKGIFR